MANYDIIAPKVRTDDLPVVRSISISDLKDVLAKGLDDFLAMPTHTIFIAVIYPIVGLLIARATFAYEIIPLLYPLAAGFAIIGPIAAIGLYELSRRRERGLDTSWKHAFDIRHSPSLGAILIVGCLLLTLFVIWIAIAQSLYVANFGYREPASLMEFVQKIFTTPQGQNLFVVGNLIGFIFAVIAFSLSVVSFPLLLDRDVGAAAAIVTSVKTVLKNPQTMAVWGLIIAAGLVIGTLPLFLGLIVIVPILGHSTWHLYRAVIEPDPNPRPDYQPRPEPVRYAAQFPASLFAPASYEDVQETETEDRENSSKGDDR